MVLMTGNVNKTQLDKSERFLPVGGQASAT